MKHLIKNIPYIIVGSAILYVSYQYNRRITNNTKAINTHTEAIVKLVGRQDTIIQNQHAVVQYLVDQKENR